MYSTLKIVSEINYFYGLRKMHVHFHGELLKTPIV